MLEAYRVLSAMVALPRFTVADLTRLSEVSAATVQTVIQRNRKLLERLGTREAVGRGRPAVEYRLRQEGLGEIARQLRACRRALTLTQEDDTTVAGGASARQALGMTTTPRLGPDLIVPVGGAGESGAVRPETIQAPPELATARDALEGQCIWGREQGPASPSRSGRAPHPAEGSGIRSSAPGWSRPDPSGSWSTCQGDRAVQASGRALAG